MARIEHTAEACRRRTTSASRTRARPDDPGEAPAHQAAPPTQFARVERSSSTPLAGEHLGLPVKRKMIAVLADLARGPTGWASPAPWRSAVPVLVLDGSCRSCGSPYLGRRMRMTRNRAGTQSSISLTVSPAACKAPPQHEQVFTSRSRFTSSRSRCSCRLGRSGRSRATRGNRQPAPSAAVAQPGRCRSRCPPDPARADLRPAARPVDRTADAAASVRSDGAARSRPGLQSATCVR